MKSFPALLLCGALLLAGCATTQQAAEPPPPPPPSARFIDPALVSRMQPGEFGGQVYVNPSADFRRYRRIMIEPVQLWVVPGGEAAALSAEQRQVIADAFHAALREALGQDFELVGRPGRGTLVFTAAISELREGGNPVLSTVSSFVPVTRLARQGTNLLTGSDPLVGGAAGALKVTDATTGELLAAALDSRDATAGMQVRTSRWDDVVAVTRFWAAAARYRLCRAQRRADCQAPN